ncbi:MAG TPA: hypothetical protein VI300_02490, partial [Solirubrobacter sp.]
TVRHTLPSGESEPELLELGFTWTDRALAEYPGQPGVFAGMRQILPTATLLLTAGALAWSAAPAHACAIDPDTGETTCGPPPPTHCTAAPAHWTTQPRLLIHTAEAPGDTTLLKSVGTDVMNQFNAIGATSAKITGVTTTTTAFKYEKRYDDPVPTIHVGFAPQATILDANGDEAGGLTSDRYMGLDCQPSVTIEFPMESAWDYGSPGENYYDAGPKNTDKGGTWWRPSLMHEVLHAFDLDHTSAEYAYMNHRGSGGFPWANRPAHEEVRPLPYDDELIRAAYPGSGSRWDVAALNTWYEFTDTSKGKAADQVKLCSPSVGTRWSDETSSDGCAADGTTTVGAAGSVLRTRFALANYSTGAVDVTYKLWLSKDRVWDASDLAVAAEHTDHLDEATSKLEPDKWTLPALCSGVTYHPIIRVEATHYNVLGQPVTITDWIPLRGDGLQSTWGCPIVS